MMAARRLSDAWANHLMGRNPDAREPDPWLRMAEPRIMSVPEIRTSVLGPEFSEPDVVQSTNGRLDVTLNVALADNVIGNDKVRLRNYNGKLTGPTLMCRPGDTLYITLRNNLSLESAMPGAMNTLHNFNTTNLHTHGLHVSPSGNSDNVLLKVGPGTVQEYEIAIPKDHPCGTFWYHAHEHGSTAANVGSGMSGALVIQGGIDDVQGLKGIKDRILVLQQIPYVNNDNAAVCKFTPGAQEIGVVEAEYVDCCFGPGSWDRLQRYTTINGLQIPVIHVLPGSIERWRFIDSAVREVIRPGLVLQPQSNPNAPNAIQFHEIAVDGLPLGRIAPRDQLELWPGYRSDVLVQIPASAAGAVYELHDFRPTIGGQTKENRQQLAIIVVDKSAPVNQAMPDPALLAPFRPPSIKPAEVKGQQFAAYGIVFRNNVPVFTVDRHAFDDQEARQLWLGEVHEWSMTSRNSTAGPISVSHPFHIHVNPFEVFSITDPSGKEQLDIDPNTHEPIPVWRDTIVLNEGWKVQARTRYTDFTGTFVQHCHILDHEDQGMMELVQINDRPQVNMADAKAQPLRPWTAPEWSLPDAKGEQRSFSSLRKGASLLVFFEGFGCLRCNEQIQQLIERQAEFSKAGLQIIGVSTDDINGLASVLKDTPCPFPIVADPGKAVFARYGSMMDEAPMHGVFLVDDAGKVRWQAVTAEPWLDWQRVLSESKHLRRDVKPVNANAATR